MILALNAAGKGVELKKIASKSVIKNIYKEKGKYFGKILD
jgi:hypothetical protein